MKHLLRLTAAFARLGVATRLYCAFAIVLLLTAAVGGVGLVGLQRLNHDSSDLSDKWLPGVGQLASARAAMLEGRDWEVKHSRSDDRSYHAEYEGKAAETTKAVAEALAGYEKLLVGDDERKLFGNLKKRWTDYQSTQQKVFALGREKKQQDAADISDGLGSTAADDAVAALEALWKFNFAGGAAASQTASKTHDIALKAMGGLLIASLVIGIGLAGVFVRSLLRQLGGEPSVAVEIARAVAAGDLSTAIALRPGDTQSLMAQLQAMQAALATAVTAVRLGSDSVATASEQIAQGNADLSTRTEQQAGALQQTASSMEELGATVLQNAETARRADGMARDASNVAAKGGDAVAQVVATMKGINDSSKRIADIIGVIDGIAFQTNILALNAAVEAARAGEQGRGFAVVAGEVRSLAQRSAAAASEIKGLISASVERVEQGTRQVDAAGVTMNEVVGAIQRVTQLMSEISTASDEQSAGVKQVGDTVSQMDQATQQNAAMVEESAAAAESLKQQARMLVEAVAVFRLHASRQAQPA